MIYLTSDWHGCPPADIQKLLKAANFGNDDYMFVLGDVIDRGKHGVDHLKWLMLQPNVELLLGNHEAMLLACDFLFEEVTEESVEAFDADKLRLLADWQLDGGEETLQGLRCETPEMRRDILEFLREAPLYDTVSVGGRDFVLVHAGLGEYREDKALSEYTPDQLLWMRHAPGLPYSDKFITVHGHTPTCIYGREYRGRMICAANVWNIDTGAACDLSPMLYCLDTDKAYYLEGGEVLCEKNT